MGLDVRITIPFQKLWVSISPSYENYKLMKMSRLNTTFGALLAKEKVNLQHDTDILLDTASAYRSAGEYRCAIRAYAEAYKQSQGPQDYNAWNVNPSEYAKSCRERVGTHDIHDGVAVALYCWSHRMVSFAHIDSSITENSIGRCLVYSHGLDCKLDAHIVGARTDNHIVAGRVLWELSQHENVRVVTQLTGMGRGVPSAVVFDPMTGHLEHAVPRLVHSTTMYVYNQQKLHGTELFLSLDFMNNYMFEVDRCPPQETIDHIMSGPLPYYQSVSRSACIIALPQMDFIRKHASPHDVPNLIQLIAKRVLIPNSHASSQGIVTLHDRR